LLAGNLPVGWDSINYYAPWTLTYARHGVLNYSFLASPPLIFTLLIPVFLLSSNIMLTVKILAPLLYGLIGLSVFHFAHRHLNWSAEKSAFCSMLLMLQPAAMRISWDLFKNELAVVLLFLQLSVISLANKKSSRKATILMFVLPMLIVLSHQYVALVYFIIILYTLLSKNSTRFFRKHLASTHIPAFMIFLVIVGIYAQWNVPVIQNQVEIARPLTSISYFDFPAFSFFQNYIQRDSYATLLSDTLTLFFLLYALILPLAILGFWHDRFLTPFLIFLTLGAFLPLASPSLAIPGSERWMWMLAYVFPFYAVNGISKLKQRYDLALNGKFHEFHRATHYVYARKLEIIYILLIVSFAFSYEFGMLHQLYEPIQKYVPNRFSQTIISSAEVKEIAANVEWLNGQYGSNFRLDFFDHFEDLDPHWQCKNRDDMVLGNSTITFNISANRECYASTDFGLDYFGSIEVRFKISSISEESNILTIRRSNGHGGGVIYVNESLKYWDSENMVSYDLFPLDADWHVVRVVCNETGKTISIDGLEKLHDGQKEPFGVLILGSTSGSRTGSGSSSIDYVSVQGYLKPCLLTYFRELGIVWINLDERFEIITCAQDFQGALNYAANGYYTQIFLMLPTNPFNGNFATVHEMPHYSIFEIDHDSIFGAAAYIEAAVNKPQSGGSWVSVRDDFSWSGLVMKASASSMNDDTLSGPYIDHEWTGDNMQGRLYVVTFRLKVSSYVTSGVVSVDVCHSEGVVLKSMVIKASDFVFSDTWQDFQLTFAVPNSLIRGLEFRVRNLNNNETDVFVDRISVRKTCNASIVYAEAAVNKPQSGGSWVSVRDDFSWSGLVMKASASSLNGDFLFGPYIDTELHGKSILGKQYVATFRLKASSNQLTSDVLYVDVSYDLGRVLNSSLIKASDFSSPDGWQDFQLAFSVPSSLNYGLELRIKNLNNGVADVFVDYISVKTG